jgi:predicted naringenin-chalcone synthase
LASWKYIRYWYNLISGHKTGIEKRHFHLTEEILRAHPEFLDRQVPSLDARIDMAAAAVPKLAESAAAKAIAEWGRPATDITHLVFSTYSGCRAPSADLRLASLLGLRHSVCRTILSLHGCYGGARALHLAKEIAENNLGARVLVACSEITLVCFGEPDGGNLVGHALFGDGAGAVIVGAGPLVAGERPLFEMVSATQTTIPGTEYALGMQVAAGGIDFHLAIQVPMLLGQNVERCLLDAFSRSSSSLGGVGDDDDADDDAGDVAWNDLFWAVHPGGRPILDKIEAVLKLEPGKLAASRHVLREYGNMSGATIVFVLDELRRRRREEEAGDRDQQLPEWGVMMAFGPGITVETMVLRAPRNPNKEN